MGFAFVQMMGHALFQGKMIDKKNRENALKTSSTEPNGYIAPKLAQNTLSVVKGIHLFQN